MPMPTMKVPSSPEDSFAAGASIDPVCGMTVDGDHAAATIVHDGKTVRFCSQSCARRFESDPNAYSPQNVATPIKKHACCGGASSKDEAHPAPRRSVSAIGAANPTGQMGAVHICPMHPHVRQIGPGSCPECGMDLEPELPTLEPSEDPTENDYLRRLKRSGLAAALVVLSAMARHMTGFDPLAALFPSAGLVVEMLLTAWVMIVGGRPFFERASRSIKDRSPGMFTLIALGTGAAFVQGVVATMIAIVRRDDAHHAAVYFESSAAIIALTLIGQILELRARRKTGDAVSALLRLAPPTAELIADDGSTEEVPLEQVAPGDRLLVKPGSKIPVDGRVVSGESWVDRSLLTGESMPVFTAAGAEVTGGTMNQNGALTMIAEKVGASTVLAKITQMVAAAQRSRLAVQDIADRFAARLFPIVLLCAAATLFFWSVATDVGFGRAVEFAVAVLIVACPCAVGLAVPMSVMVGVGRGARLGILFRDAAALEALADGKTIVFDKTGTLTEGKPSLVTIEAAPEFDETQVLAWAAAIERGSEHPLAHAIVAAAEARSIRLATADRITATAGAGVGGFVDGVRIDIGSERHLEALGIETAPLMSALEGFRSDGMTGILIAVDRKIAAAVAIADTLKPEAPSVLARLRRLGMRITLLSGDAAVTARAIGRRLGIDDVIGEARPQDKGRFIDELKKRGSRPIMVGDGTNDAPALAAADVGIALGTGTDIANAAAGITIVGGRLDGVADAVVLARAVQRNARQNLAAAFVYNALALPAAAGVLFAFGIRFSPMAAAVTMTLSSLSVILNALRLRSLRIGADARPEMRTPREPQRHETARHGSTHA